MLGGDDCEDNLEEILAEVQNQVDRPEPSGSSRTPRNVGTAPRRVQQSAQSTDATVQAVLDQNSRLMEALLGQGQEHEGKRKTREFSHSPQEPVLLFEESYRIEDDGHEKIGTAV